MNRLLNIFLLFVFSAVVCFANTGEQSVKVNPGGTISIHMSSSDITINVWQKNEVLVRTNDDEELKITNRNNIVKIEPGISGYTEHLFVNIPSSFNVVVNTSAGDLEINGDIKGNLEIYNGGGDIDFRNINGRVIVKTGGGDIHGNNINGNTSLKSSGGDINLGSVKGKASIVTGGGNIKLNSVTVIDIINTSGGNIM
ncbi:MAG: hypothetical protein EHM47_17645, partial [Ignavibacteriales bacterium]